MAQQRSASGGPTGRGWAIAGIVCGVLTLVVPILFGPLGVVFGYVGRRKGAASLGTTAIVISVAVFVIVVVLGAILGAIGALA